MFLNVAFPIFNAVVRGMARLKLINISLLLLFGVQFISCLFLFDALRRILVVARKNPDLKINVVATIIHAGSYIVFLISLIYFYITVFCFHLT